jgi:DNA invertase Pin-like site-specific DNA recombinase
MTELLCSPKIKPEHLARKAIVYLRQSSEKQVRYNLESQRLQYEVADRIRNLGWSDVEIIDSDLGFSAGMASARREGFERVISWVALGEVGIVGSREVSRLSRTDKDWCRLLEVCQIFGTLIADEQQIYDLNYLDDQLVLGIKGTLSVVELKVLRQRMQAGQESKARRGELFKRLPVGYTRDLTGKIVLHPDQRICEAIRLVFILVQRPQETRPLDHQHTGRNHHAETHVEGAVHKASLPRCRRWLLRVGEARREDETAVDVLDALRRSVRLRWRLVTLEGANR